VRPHQALAHVVAEQKALPALPELLGLCGCGGGGQCELMKTGKLYQDRKTKEKMRTFLSEMTRFSL
jgi:hypothetical protein